MPALTIAAECRYADTGVGAAIAPGSQKWAGTIADLDSAPARIRMTAGSTYGVAASCSMPLISDRVQTPVCWPNRMMPTSMARPPRVVTMSAWPAACRDEARSP